MREGRDAGDREAERAEPGTETTTNGALGLQTDPAGGPGAECVPPMPMWEGGTLDPISKKIRNLNKKARCLRC